LVIATGSCSLFPGNPTAINPKLTKEEGLKLYDDFYNEVSTVYPKYNFVRWPPTFCTSCPAKLTNKNHCEFTWARS